MGELLIDFAAKSVDAGGYPTLAANLGSAVARLLELEKSIPELTEADLAYIGKFAATAASLSTEAVVGIHSIPEKNAVLQAM